jgi:GDPmannose 4,6-dehydratase|tara:strand:+ start:37525 stop:38619 length:1095 start_codon:yes stop_codon:yes gene_type:complete
MKKRKKSLISGANGQDGSYLCELLLEKGYEVHGIIRRASVFNTERIDHLMEIDNFNLHYGDVTDPLVISNLVSKIQPDEFYNLAAQSHVKVSFEIPYYTATVDALGALSVLEAVRNHAPQCKVYQASTSELYGGLSCNKNEYGEYDETSKFHPRSPYGVAKIYGFWIVKNYREAYNMFACNGILFNHESPRRGKTFVTRKITQGLCSIKLNKGQTLKLGNLDAYRDWGHAKDYVEGMWMMLQQDKADDYVLATGHAYSVRNFCEETCARLDFNLVWVGEGEEEMGVDEKTGEILIEIDPKHYRPTEVNRLLGCAKKAEQDFGWKSKTSFKELVEEMTYSDYLELGGTEKEVLILKSKFNILNKN